MKFKISRLRPHAHIKKVRLKTPCLSGKISSGGSSSSTQRKSIGVSTDSQDDALRHVLADIFLTNKLSALDTFRLARGAMISGSSDVGDLAKVGAGGKHVKNLARDLMSALLKDCVLPDIFWWRIPVWDLAADCQTMVELPFLLPHEYIHTIVSGNGIPMFIESPDTYVELAGRKQSLCQQLGLPCDITVPIGLHGDGVPYTKRDSLEMFAWNFLAHPCANRIPFTGISKQFTCKCGCKGRHTFNAILDVFVWSFKMLITGTIASVLPDGKKWPELTWRPLQPGAKLVCRALLLQCRGDWPFLRTLFAFPAWNSESICWLCKANHSDLNYKQCGKDAPWRNCRYAAGEFVVQLRSQNIQVSSLLSLPGFSISCIVLDWLHVVDLGLGADVLGCLFWEVIDKSLLPGSTKAERLKSLWNMLQLWYKEHKPASKLTYLTAEMIRAGGKKPKLKCKGAECRYLIPFGKHLAGMFKDLNTHQRTVYTLFARLNHLQELVAGSLPFDAKSASEACRQFCVMYNALEMEAIGSGQDFLWTFKPKGHLLQELVEYQAWEHGCPSFFLTYRDESWCGHWARHSRRRGGANTPSITAQRLLQRFRALAPPLSVVIAGID